MHWVTKRGIKINRAATAWLIRRFVDPEAIFVFVAAGEVGNEARRLGGTGFHAPGTMYPARDARGRTPFEAIAEDRCGDDVTLRAMSVIVRHADVPQQSEAPEAAGLRLISGAFPLIARDDAETVERSAFMYDALYAALQEREKGAVRKEAAPKND
ncbi:MAG TPA: chromate resistance protein ChrB domain-containing protein [Gemmatimonadaceae bacterium]|nr:chromate resistance protein ChrB domain-containing protein [Gemmatimonadaceae bacterium]